MRYGENPRDVIDRVKQKIAALESELGGIQIHGIYDRTLLIDETVATLSDALVHETLITIAVMVLFLLHVRASLVIAITLPMAVLMSFIAMKVFGVDANIMSLAGIAIAIGTMVDMGIIVLENIYGRLADWEAAGSPERSQRPLASHSRSRGEVVPAVITAVSTTIVSFLPVFFLTGRDHRLFAPLAWTKTFALAASLIVAVTVVPLLCRLFLRSPRRKSWPDQPRDRLELCGALRRALLFRVGRSARSLDRLARGMVRGGSRRCGLLRRLVDDAGKNSADGREPRQPIRALDVCGPIAIGPATKRC